MGDDSNLQIYVVQPAVERYKQLADTESEELSDARFSELLFNGKPKNGSWNPPTLEWISGADIEGPKRKTYDSKYKTPDIAHWYTGCLVLNPKATKVLKPLFSDEAEFIPVPVDGEEWKLLNVTTLQDIFDKANSQYKIRPNGKVGRLLNMAVDKSKLTNGKLFKIIGKKSGLYTDDALNSFKEIVEQNKLSGLKFKEVSTDDRLS